MSTLICDKVDSAFWIRINRPNKRNALDQETYTALIERLTEANNDPSIVYTVFTGEGKFYSSGNDFAPQTLNRLNSPGSLALAIDNTANFIDTLIAHTKILVALVNGPAIGIGCTMLALFDYVIASETAYFQCPFSEFGLIPECTTTVSLPALIGYQAAARILLFDERIDAAEAKQIGLVGNVIADGNDPVIFRKLASKMLDSWQRRLVPHAMLKSKAVMRGVNVKQALYDANHNEAVIMKSLWQRGETLQRVMGHFTKTNRSKI